MNATFCFYGAIVLTGLCFGILAVIVLRAFSEGATAYTGTYSDSTSRQLEDLFLFSPPRRIAEASWACAVIAFLLFAGLLFNIEKPLFLIVGLFFFSLSSFFCTQMNL